MAQKKSLYYITEHAQDALLNNGYDYEGNILANTMSSFMFKDPKRANILAKIEAVVFELISQVKCIKNTRNYMVPKNQNIKN